MVHVNIFELLGSNLIKKNEKKATKCKLHIEMLSKLTSDKISKIFVLESDI